MRNTAIGATAAVAVLAGLVAAGPAPAAPVPPASPSAPSAEKKRAKTARVHGKARISYIESINDDIRFTIDAQQVPFSRPVPPVAPEGMATDARGTLKISHTTRSGAAGWAEARVDCLVTSGRTATLTAIVTKAPTQPGAAVRRG